MERNLAKNYDPKDFEERIYKMWESCGAFRAEIDEDKKPYTIIMPPPNITGQLHMGHALDHTLQDVLVRWKRMQGYSALWLPGSDHASIATEAKVSAKLRKEGKKKEDIGREEFLKIAWSWKKEYGGKITEQCRKLGDSCDWSRERFTMDEGCSRAVRHFFVSLYDKGLIYRGNRLINWCPTCMTSLSDVEVEHEDKNGLYWYFRYPAAEKDGKDIVIATSRPETMFGDTAIAVRPDDERYKDMIGKKVILPLVGREIPIIADPYPDPEKGTGAVKVTPAHDPNDFEIGQRAGLESICCISPDATMNSAAGKYEGMSRYECRKQWVADLDAAGYLVKTEEKVIPVGECYRCHTAIEPMLSDQWFVKMKGLAQPAIEAAKKGELRHVPERFGKVYLHWLEGIHDWCISRQLWWGHRIPVWYCGDCGEVIAAEEEPKACPKCGSAHLRQDEDVLDTWFSSALWPFSTLGWPEKTGEIGYFYPTDVLVTGYDIIFFWVVRMVFSACEATGGIPFRDVYIHGLVRDRNGVKMSRTLGNGVDPLEVIEQHGADALRFMLTTGITPGNDMRFKEERLEACANFANKLWNASRFVIMNIAGDEGEFSEISESPQTSGAQTRGGTRAAFALKDEDKWIIGRINDAVKYMTESLEKYDIALAGQRIYTLIWNEYCDWYIEFAKRRLWGDDEEDKKTVRFVLVCALKDILKLLHPFMPFITEEIWSFLPHTEREKEGNPDCFIMKAKWPLYSEEKEFGAEEEKTEALMAAIRAIRSIRAEAGAAPGRKLRAYILSGGRTLEALTDSERLLRDLAGVTEVIYINDKKYAPEEVMSAVIDGAEIFIPLGDLVDFSVEFERLTKEKERLEKEVARAAAKLSNKGFVTKAPEKLVAEEREKKAKYEDMLEKVESRLKAVAGKVGR